ncbi:MAG TPA: hypothetical protein VE076_02650, partial [Nitrososphaeraceae archaeon]|nr:hypothetical protein [Nitrososphaeraceae archaeon]
ITRCKQISSRQTEKGKIVTLKRDLSLSISFLYSKKMTSLYVCLHMQSIMPNHHRSNRNPASKGSECHAMLIIKL